MVDFKTFLLSLTVVLSSLVTALYNDPSNKHNWLPNDIHKNINLLNTPEIVKKGGKTTEVENLVVSLRQEKLKAKIHNHGNVIQLPTTPTFSNLKNSKYPYPNPYDEKINAGNPCPMRGLVVRREMGELGVTSFQLVISKLIMYALGPSWSYYDDWPKLAQLLQPDRHFTQEEAFEFREKCDQRLITISPTEQDGLSLIPFNITDGSWVRHIREEVCGPNSKYFRQKRQGYLPNENDPCMVVKIQRHWQHTGFYYRYREFIASNILRSYNSMKTEYIDELKEDEQINSQWMGKVADLVVYLRLGDKTVAGDTTLTFASGYYDIVLTEARPKANTCWIITQTVNEPRATQLASKHRCLLVSSPKQYTDWTLLLTAPGTLVMAASTFIYFQALIGKAKEVHYPAVGFFHDKHNVCMRQNKKDSHFGQIRLPIDDPKMIYHDIYSRVWFMNYQELAAQVKSLPCDSIIDQHVCDFKKNSFKFGGESRYCYRAENRTSLAAQVKASYISHKHGQKALDRYRKSLL